MVDKECMLIKIMYIQFLLVILFDVLNLRQDFFGVLGGGGGEFW